MRLLFFLVSKNWASSHLRLVLTWLGVALGVAVVMGIHILDHNTILSQLERRRWAYGEVDFELRPKNTQIQLDAALAELRKNPDLASVGLLNRASIRMKNEAGTVARAFFYGLSPLARNPFGHYRVARGKAPSDLETENRVLLPDTLAEALGLAIGDRFIAEALPLEVLGACVDGRLVSPDRKEKAEDLPRAELVLSGILEPVRLARQHAGLVVIGSFGLANHLGRHPRPVVQVDRAEGVDPDRLAASFREDYVVETERSALIGEDADERAFRNGVKVLGALALVLGMFVIFHTLSHSLAERIRRLGILRSLGATQSQVSQVFLLDSFLLAVFGAVGGLFGGIGMALALEGLGLTTLGFGKTIGSFELPWGDMIVIALLGVGFTMMGAAFPLFKIRNLSPTRILHARDLAPPVDLMRGVHVFLLVLLVLAVPVTYLALTPLLESSGQGAVMILVQVVGIIALAFALLLLTPRLVPVLGSFPLALFRRSQALGCFLVRKQLLRSPGRIGTSVCGLTLVALAMLGLRSLTASLKGEIHGFSQEALAERLFVRADSSELLPRQAWQRIQDLPEVETVLPLLALHNSDLLMVGTESLPLAAKGGVFEGAPDLARRFSKERTLVLSRRLASLRKASVGDRLPILVGSRVEQYEVLAVSDRDGFFPDERAFALIDLRWMKQDFCQEPNIVRDMSLRLAKGSSYRDAERSIRKLGYPLSWVQSGQNIESFYLKDVDRDFFFFDVLLYLLLVLAGVGQVNLITLFTLAREREIGVLRALGLTRQDFVKVLLLESLVLGFLATLLTLVIGLPLSYILVHGLREVSGLSVPFVFPMAEAMAVSLLIFVVALLASLLPALRVAGLPPARAVRAPE